MFDSPPSSQPQPINPDNRRRLAPRKRSSASVLLYNTRQDGIDGPPAEEVDRRRESAERLGGHHLIPPVEIAFDPDSGESVGDYEIGDQETIFFDLIRNRLAVGQRAFAFRGPPGTGKDSFARQIAAIRGAPYLAFNIGPTFSFEDAIGSDGLDAQTIHNEDGDAVGIASTSKALDGPLARAVREDCVVVIQEPEGLANEAVRLHSAAGDNIGDPTRRYLTVNAAGGELALPVNPECIIVFTYNSGAEDVRFKSALHDRMGNFDFEYPDQETESRRYARMVTKMMHLQQEAPELARQYDPEEMLPMVRIIERARQAHQQNPSEFVDAPGARQGAHCYCDLLLQGYGGDENAVETMATMLRYMLPGSELMTVEQRDARIRDVVTSDDFQELNEIAMRASEARKETDEA